MTMNANDALMQRFLRETAKPDGGLATYGETETNAAVMANNVDALLVNINEWKKSSNIRAIATENGATVHLFHDGVSANILRDGFGGIAAILRYKPN